MRRLNVIVVIENEILIEPKSQSDCSLIELAFRENAGANDGTGLFDNPVITVITPLIHAAHVSFQTHVMCKALNAQLKHRPLVHFG